MIRVFGWFSGNWILETAKTGAVYKKFQFGTRGDIPVTGDWNGDGNTDIGVFRLPETGSWRQQRPARCISDSSSEREEILQ